MVVNREETLRAVNRVYFTRLKGSREEEENNKEEKRGERRTGDGMRENNCKKIRKGREVGRKEGGFERG